MEKLFTTKVRAGITTLIVSVIMGLAFSNYVVITKINGASMYPTLLDGEYKLINKFAFKYSEPSYGDIIVCNIELTNSVVVKRVIALPGDTVEIINGKILLNGEFLIEDYIKEPMVSIDPGLYNELTPDVSVFEYLNREVLLDENEYFIMGDNRNNSADSRIFGPVTRNEIVGKLVP